jgi:predicted dehydrogenase
VLRLGILSFWHVHAADYAREAQQHPRTEIVAAWDEDAERGRAKAQSLGATFHADLADLLARPDIDGVIVTTPTNAHRDVIVAAAKAGKHIFTEKVLALTPAECRRILAVVDRADVKLTVSLPRLADGYTQATLGILADGRLGDLTLVRVRLSHDGAVGRRWLPAQFFDPDEAGGGALIDLGCHPMYLTRLFLGGMPDRLTASYGHVTGHAVEDNAVALLHFPNGAIGVVEAGFVNPHSPFTIEVHGTKGSLLYGTPEARMLVRNTPAGRDEAWTEVALPERAAGPFDQWVSHIEHGTLATENIALAVDLTTLMDAANRSARTGRTIQLGRTGG